MQCSDSLEKEDWYARQHSNLRPPSPWPGSIQGGGQRRRGLYRSDRLLGSRGSGTELAIEGLVDEGTQPGADVEVALGAEALEALTGIGRDADVNRNTKQHRTTQ